MYNAERMKGRANMSGNIPLVRPEWIKVKSGNTDGFAETLSIVKKYGVSTVCEEALCPNIGECWKHRTATFMIMGYICTRNCGFCGIKSGTPRPLDPEEPTKVAMAVKNLGLKYAVITTVSRDDIEDGGASHFAAVIKKINELTPETKVEILAPDFRGNEQYIKIVSNAKPDVYGHNIEVVRRLHKAVKKPPSDYDISIETLKIIKKLNKNMISKSGMMVGVGETFDEVMETLEDLRSANVDVVTLGQYISPSASHYPIVKYVTPDEFAEYRKRGLEMGFKEVLSGPLVRSSYKAGETFSSLCAIGQ